MTDEWRAQLELQQPGPVLLQLVEQQTVVALAVGVVVDVGETLGTDPPVAIAALLSAMLLALLQSLHSEFYRKLLYVLIF